ncbi:hypothetical protein EYF80_015312 [Liparis tanakae]|uniref:Uncharacterized protein n=1 Tax=Liparis tanakae TaxID=230148 RepID=A0A4Z2IAW2_9TELE|nr:hypothetical protein EYF80_015312 [Liparis tanakae]
MVLTTLFNSLKSQVPLVEQIQGQLKVAAELAEKQLIGRRACRRGDVGGDLGAAADPLMDLRLLDQQLPVRDELRCSGQQGGDTMHKLWHQAGVGIVSLAEMVGYHLTKRRGRVEVGLSDGGPGLTGPAAGQGAELGTASERVPLGLELWGDGLPPTLKGGAQLRLHVEVWKKYTSRAQGSTSRMKRGRPDETDAETTLWFQLSFPPKSASLVGCERRLHPQVSSAPAALIRNAKTVPFQSPRLKQQRGVVYSLVPGFLSLSAVCIIISFEPTCELEARLGGNYIGLAREKRGGGQRNGRPFGQSPQLPFAFSVAAVVVPEAGGTTAATAPLKRAVSVRLITCRDNIEKDSPSLIHPERMEDSFKSRSPVSKCCSSSVNSQYQDPTPFGLQCEPDGVHEASGMKSKDGRRTRCRRLIGPTTFLFPLMPNTAMLWGDFVARWTHLDLPPPPKLSCCHQIFLLTGLQEGMEGW